MSEKPIYVVLGLVPRTQRAAYALASKVVGAIQRKKTIEHYTRDWKINHIERTNPFWADLYPTLPGAAPVPALLPSGALGPRDKPEDDS